jgi:hypothetical protein
MMVLKMVDFSGCIKKIGAWAGDKSTVESYRRKKTYFTRTTAKLTFDRLIAFILGNNRNSAQVALNDFFRDTEDEPVAKQTLFEARDKISYEAFVDLHKQLVDDFYAEDDIQTYRSYNLLGVDGSLFQAPQGALETFGGQKSAKCDTVSAQSRALVISDVLNRIIVHAALNPVDDGERKIFLDSLRELRDFIKALLIFDRGFYSKELVRTLNEKGVAFLFRLKLNRCQKVIDSANEPDQVITVEGTQLRIINFVLPTGKVEKLATNIFDDTFTISDFAAIYEKRWGVETSFLMVKERIAIENFTSSKKNLMLQDFYASVITYNLMEIACMEQEEKRRAENIGIERKYEQSANRNIAAREVRECLLSILIEADSVKIEKTLTKMQRIIYRFVKDIRSGRTNPRNTKFPSKKYPMNKKRNL